MAKIEESYIEETGRGKSEKVSRPLVDMADPANTKSLQQSHLRDKLGKQHGAVILFCPDSDLSKCTDVKPKAQAHYSPAKLTHIASELNKVMSSGDCHSKLRSGFHLYMQLIDVLGGACQTFKPPMLESSKSYWETVTRPCEKRLVESLSASSGSITHDTMMKKALSICSNDLPLAIITLANFTKNMAAIERRQISSQCKKRMH